jgi:hypothetical protein
LVDYVSVHGPAGTSAWRFFGDSRANTDHGRVYADVTPALVTLYRDAAMQHAVAQGAPDAAHVSFEPVNDSGLSATCTLDASTHARLALDVFHADDADLLARQADLAGLLTDGNFAGQPGFAAPRRRAKRTLDALLDMRLPAGWRADDLQPLTDAAAAYALYFLYDHLATRADLPAAELARAWRARAR